MRELSPNRDSANTDYSTHPRGHKTQRTSLDCATRCASEARRRCARPGSRSSSRTKRSAAPRAAAACVLMQLNPARHTAHRGEVRPALRRAWARLDQRQREDACGTAPRPNPRPTLGASWRHPPVALVKTAQSSTSFYFKVGSASLGQVACWQGEVRERLAGQEGLALFPYCFPRAAAAGLPRCSKGKTVGG